MAVGASRWQSAAPFQEQGHGSSDFSLPDAPVKEGRCGGISSPLTSCQVPLVMRPPPSHAGHVDARPRPASRGAVCAAARGRSGDAHRRRVSCGDTARWTRGLKAPQRGERGTARFGCSPPTPRLVCCMCRRARVRISRHHAVVCTPNTRTHLPVLLWRAPVAGRRSSQHQASWHCCCLSFIDNSHSCARSC